MASSSRGGGHQLSQRLNEMFDDDDFASVSSSSPFHLISASASASASGGVCVRREGPASSHVDAVTPEEDEGSTNPTTQLVRPPLDSADAPPPLTADGGDRAKSSSYDRFMMRAAREKRLRDADDVMSQRQSRPDRLRYDPELPHLLRDPILAAHEKMKMAKDRLESSSSSTSSFIMDIQKSLVVRADARRRYRVASNQDDFYPTGGGGSDSKRLARISDAVREFLDRNLETGYLKDVNDENEETAPVTPPSRCPEDVCIVFDTSTLLSTERWYEVLNVFLQHNNVVVLPSIVVGELDFHVKKYQAITRRDADDTVANGGYGKANSENAKQELLGKRAMVLRDWMLLRQEDQLMRDCAPNPAAGAGDEVVVEDEFCGDPAERSIIRRIQRTYRLGRLVLSSNTDCLLKPSSSASRGGTTALSASALIRNNDDRILDTCLWLREKVITNPTMQAGGRKINANLPSALLLVTEDKMLSLKAKSESIVCCGAVQLLTWQ